MTVVIHAIERIDEDTCDVTLSLGAAEAREVRRFTVGECFGVATLREHPTTPPGPDLSLRLPAEVSRPLVHAIIEAHAGRLALPYVVFGAGL